jgi:HPt (histidine-containing phosphotransfer) domain-containing protein
MLIDYLPEDKVHLYGSPEYAADLDKMQSKNAVTGKGSLAASPKEETLAEEKAREVGRISGLDINEGIRNCGSAETFLKIAADYYSSIEEKRRLIEESFQAGDWENYTIQVHSLKSSSRLIGASKLSKDAAYLEKCGDAGNTAEINRKTPALLTLFDGLRDRLKIFFDRREDDSSKLVISESELSEYRSGIKELVEAFDFESAEDAMKELKENYKIPDNKIELYLKVESLLRSANRDALLELLRQDL